MFPLFVAVLEAAESAGADIKGFNLCADYHHSGGLFQVLRVTPEELGITFFLDQFDHRLGEFPGFLFVEYSDNEVVFPLSFRSGPSCNRNSLRSR